MSAKQIGDVTMLARNGKLKRGLTIRSLRAQVHSLRNHRFYYVRVSFADGDMERVGLTISNWQLDSLRRRFFINLPS